MCKSHSFSTTSIYFYASLVCLGVSVGSSAMAATDLGASVQGIHGGDRAARGISDDDSETAGIHGGDRSTRGIHGDDRRIFDSAAMGPVDSLEVIDEGYLLTIVGQTFISKSASIPVTEGDYVLAAGSDGSLDILMPIGMTYVAGASPVLVIGTVSDVWPSIAELSIGDLAIDYSAHLSTDATFSPAAGELVEFMGVQPLPGGNAILNIQDGADSYLRGIHGGDRSTRRISDDESETAGIHGGDRSTRGIDGSGIR